MYGSANVHVLQCKVVEKCFKLLNIFLFLGVIKSSTRHRVMLIFLVYT